MVALPMDTTAKLAALRQLMASNQLEAYLVPSEDAHQSEYIAPCDGRRAWISGFTGSAGLVVVTLQEAALWTDGRYFLQASKQLDKNWTLMKSGLPGVLSKEEWLNKNLKQGARIGLDPKLITVAGAKALSDALVDKVVVSVQENLIDKIWTDRPNTPQSPVRVLDLKYAGKPMGEKIEELRSQFEKQQVWGFVVTALDEIACRPPSSSALTSGLFNLRGSDIPYNPVFFAYALITVDEIILYINDQKLNEEVWMIWSDINLKVKRYLNHVKIRPYDAIFTDFKQNYATSMKGSKLWIDSRCNLALQEAIGGADAVKESRSPIMVAKGIKNDVEMEGFRQCHIRDAAALCQFFAWLEKELVVQKNTRISEVDAADKLEHFRSLQPDFVGLSFDTISGIGPNGAIIHYKPEKETCSLLRTDQVYLLDSGGQYKDGTTDVTRTVHFGEPKENEKEAFTLVLKGHIQIDLAIFPQGTTGYVLDVLARTPLWRAGLDFRHGTGHGVGHYLNVHEGPHGIGQRIAYNDVPLKVGMTVTNEPGYYQEGSFGIRIENVLLVRKAETKYNFGDQEYLRFEHVTVVPIQTKLINVSLLTPEEKDWINRYNLECFTKVSPLLPKDSDAFKWLKKETVPI